MLRNLSRPRNAVALGKVGDSLTTRINKYTTADKVAGGCPFLPACCLAPLHFIHSRRYAVAFIDSGRDASSVQATLSPFPYYCWRKLSLSARPYLLRFLNVPCFGYGRGRDTLTFVGDAWVRLRFWVMKYKADDFTFSWRIAPYLLYISNLVV